MTYIIPTKNNFVNSNLIYKGCLDALYPSTDPQLFWQSVREVQDLSINRILPRHHQMGIPVDIIGRIENGFGRLWNERKLKQGNGVFDFGDFQIQARERRIWNCETLTIRAETIVNYNTGEQTVTVYTRDKAVMRKLDTLVVEFPDTYSLAEQDEVSKTYSFPKSYISYRKPRAISTEQRERARQMMIERNREKVD